MLIYSASLVFVLILCFSVEINNAQATHPLFLHQGLTLGNHSYVDITGVSTTFSGTLQCETDLSTCCTGTHGPFRGRWSFPNGVDLISGQREGIFQAAESRRVHLRREGDTTSPTGIYRCAIPTIAVHNDSDASVRAVIFVGIYTPDTGDVMIPGDVVLTVESDLNGPSPQFTLTCISTGGPATNVTWTRDSVPVTNGTETVLNDRVTATYTHTLTVTGRQPGLYTCTVSNNKPSNASKSIRVGVASAPTDLRYEVQNYSTNVLIIWTPPCRVGDTTGYMISLSGENIRGTINIDGGLRNNISLPGQETGATYYNISIIGISDYNSETDLHGVIPIDTADIQSELGNKERETECELSYGTEIMGMFGGVLGLLIVIAIVIITGLLILVVYQRQRLKSHILLSVGPMRRDIGSFITSTNQSYSVTEVAKSDIRVNETSYIDMESIKTSANQSYSLTAAGRSRNEPCTDTENIKTSANESYSPTAARRPNIIVTTPSTIPDAESIKTSTNQSYSLTAAGRSRNEPCTDTENIETSANESYSPTAARRPNIRRVTTPSTIPDTESIKTSTNQSYSLTAAGRPNTRVNAPNSDTEERIYTLTNESYSLTDAERFKTTINESYSVCGTTPGDYEPVDKN